MRSPDEIRHALKHAAVVGVLRPELMIDDQDVLAFQPASSVVTAILAQLRRCGQWQYDARQYLEPRAGRCRQHSWGRVKHLGGRVSSPRADSERGERVTERRG